jgi:isoquinoline 1-oxidoreductase beta subunit
VTLQRRQFLQISAGLVVGLYVEPRAPLRAAPPPAPAPKLPPPNVFLRVGSDDTVTVLLAHSEMGQGVWTTLAMLVAEELGCDWGKIRVEHAPAAPAYAHTAMGMQMTGGSTSTWSEFDRYRSAGAVARELLIAAAAQRWSVPAASCRVDNGFVVAAGKKLSFGELAEAANKLPPPAQVTLKDPKQWKILGKPQKRLDSPEKVEGRAQFGMDVRLPGMLTALVLRSPVFGGKVKAVRPERAKAVPGVKAVVQIPSGVAVVAEHFWAAKLGRDALEVDWDLGPGASLDTGRLREEMRGLLGKPGTKAAAAGDVEANQAGAVKVIEAEYEVPYLAHATMEPLNCTARVTPSSSAAASAGARPRPATSSARPCTWPRRSATARRSRSCGRARTTCAAATTARCGCTACASAWARTACRSSGSRPSSASPSWRARRSRSWSRTAST